MAKFKDGRIMIKSLDIHILCPNKKCPKCDRLKKNLTNVLKELKIDYKLNVFTEIDDMIKFKTAILPAIFVNSKLTFVGVPDFNTLKTEFKKLLNQNDSKQDK